MSSKTQLNKTSHLRDYVIETISKITEISCLSIKDDLLVREELGIDSLKAIEIIAKIEQLYNIEIEQSFLINIDTVGDFIKYIESKIK